MIPADSKSSCRFPAKLARAVTAAERRLLSSEYASVNRGWRPPSRSKILTDAGEDVVCCPEIEAMAEPEPSDVTIPLRLCDV